MTLGSRDARVGIVEFSDFQCPFCGKFARDTFPRLVQQYVKPGKLLFAFMQMPLTQIHPFAEDAAKAANCAADQGKFWQMHDLLFQNQQQLDPSHVLEYAKTVGLALPSFQECRARALPTSIHDNIQLAGKLGISGTPTFFVGTVQSADRIRVSKVLVGAQSWEQFQQVLDQLAGD